jgi:hypothetical protein
MYEIYITYICVCVFIVVSWYLVRYYLQYHYMDQVVVGAMIGAAAGGGWFYIYHTYCTPLADAVCPHPVMRFLKIRNYSGGYGWVTSEGYRGRGTRGGVQDRHMRHVSCIIRSDSLVHMMHDE